jgi:hypothetical protein
VKQDTSCGKECRRRKRKRLWHKKDEAFVLWKYFSVREKIKEERR